MKLDNISKYMGSFGKGNSNHVNVQPAIDLIEGIGGKGKNLTIMAEDGINVPSGFCISRKIFEQYKKTGIIPKGLVQKVALMKKELGGMVAIRSSGNIEDGNKASAAGIFESKYVYDDEDIEPVIKFIFDNALSGLSKDYFENNNEFEEIKLALVVQELIEDPDFSGVGLFGDHSKQEVSVIEYVNGFGNKLVDSEMVGNQAVLDKDGNIINEKKFDYIKNTLGKNDTYKLFGISTQIKNTLGLKGVDVEFAFKDNVLHILQARPLTIQLGEENEYVGQQTSSLSVIQSGIMIKGALLVCENDHKSIDELIETIGHFKSLGKKVILVSHKPHQALDKAIIRSDGMIMGSSGMASHGALRAKEFKVSTVGGAKTKNLTSGTLVDFHSTKLILNSDGHNLLNPLHEVKKSNAELVSEHQEFVDKFIIERKSEEDTIKKAYFWINEQVSENFEKDEVKIIMDIINENMPSESDSDIEGLYGESGFDSCQARRLFSKIIAQAFLIGGIVHEANIVGLDYDNMNENYKSDLDEVIEGFNITDQQIESLAIIAEKYGKNQEFLFPGVVWTGGKSKMTTKQMYTEVSEGNDLTPSVRTISGMGGLRFDKQRNHTTDFKTFLNLKVAEDKRYYPGIMLTKFLVEKSELKNFKLLNKISELDHDIYTAITNLIKDVKEQKEEDYSDLSILCSLDLSKKDEKKLGTTKDELSLFRAFHSPAYELSSFKDVLHDLSTKDTITEEEKLLYLKVIDELRTESKALKTFNSTIHLPWADNISSLSHDLIGKLKNDEGQYSVKYGVGINGRSLELVEVNFANGSKQYVKKIYDNQEFSAIPLSEEVLSKDDYKYINTNGFIKFTLHQLGVR